MKTRNWFILLGISIAIPVGWYLISPLFINRTVSEDFPTVQTAEVMEEQDAITSDKIIPEGDRAENEMDEMDETMEENKGEMMDESTSPIEDVADPVSESESAEMVMLFQGEFYNLAHEGMGIATIYQLADGTRIIRFENFEVLNGPDLHVYLTPQDPVPNTVGIELEGSIDLGKLKGNIGDQNYEIPADVDLSPFHSVVIWCQPFRVPFNAAPLRLPSP